MMSKYDSDLFCAKELFLHGRKGSHASDAQAVIGAGKAHSFNFYADGKWVRSDTRSCPVHSGQLTIHRMGESWEARFWVGADRPRPLLCTTTKRLDGFMDIAIPGGVYVTMREPQ